MKILNKGGKPNCNIKYTRNNELIIDFLTNFDHC